MKLEDFNKAQEIYVGISNIKNSIAELKKVNLCCISI